MAKSILQSRRYCYICKAWYNVYTATGLHEHHIFPGTARRELSEKYGLKVWLCAEHHRMVHSGRDAWPMKRLKHDAQVVFDGLHGPGSLASIMDKDYGDCDDEV